MKERVGGFILFAVGVFLLFECAYEPLRAAKYGAGEVTTSLKGTILAPLGVILGLVYFLFGPGAKRFMGTREDPKGLSYALVIGTVLLGLGLYWYVRSSLEAAGYDFGGRL